MRNLPSVEEPGVRRQEVCRTNDSFLESHAFVTGQ